MSICPMTYSDVVKMKEFGVVTRNECEFELFKLTENDADTLPTDANAFFELYIEDQAGDLKEVPVLIKNFRDGAGEYPNKAPELVDRLVHRFFIYDTVSGVVGEAENASPEVVRYA